ncbi:MAG: arsenic resistance N-acetyltransferase ArsN2 [Gemmatimonadaceae bacterium]
MSVLLGMPPCRGPATLAARAAIECLLRTAGLPIDGVADALASSNGCFVVARAGEEIVGVAGLELHANHALLRSVVVHPNYRSQGLARGLVDDVLDEASRRGVSEVYLLTASANGYFARIGFMPTSRAKVPPGIAGTVEFQHACPASAMVMSLDIANRGVIEPYQPTHRADFERLNRAWLEQLWVEPRDERVFADPVGAYVRTGGALWVALCRGAVVGTVALRRENAETYELCKLAVDAATRRRGIGDRLVRTVIGAARARGARRVFLTTNTVLDAAVRLYRRHGFLDSPVRAYAERTRANLEMYLELEPASREGS